MESLTSGETTNMFNPHFIKARDIPDAWFQCVYDIQDPDKARIWRIDKGSYAGQQRMEFHSITIEITNPCFGSLSDRIVRMPEHIQAQGSIPDPIDAIMYPAPACPQCGEEITSFGVNEASPVTVEPCGHEVDRRFYIDNRPTPEQYVTKYFAEYLFSDVLQEHELYTYGSRILQPVPIQHQVIDEDGRKRDNPLYLLAVQEYGDLEVRNAGESFSTFPQFYYVCAYLKHFPNTNQAVIQVAKPSDIGLADPPCLRHIDCRVIDGRLIWFIYFRSWDLWNGLPSNLAGLSLLMEQMSSETGYEPGPFICHSKGLHIYDHGWDLAKLRVGR